MADKQINELTGASSLADADVLAIEQDSGGWFTFKATLLQLYAYIASKLSAGGLTVPDASGAADGDVVTYDSGSGSPVWSPAPTTSPGGSANKLQYNDGSGGFAGATKTEAAASGSIKALEDTDTAAAPADSVIFRGEHLAGLTFPGAMDEEGRAAALQWSLSQRRYASMLPPGGSNAPTLIGMLGWTLAGNPGGNIVTFTGSLYSSFREYALASAATAGASCGYRHGLVTYGRGTVPRMGGFHMSFVFGISDAAAVADARMFVGVIGSAAAIGNVNPSTLTNIVGVGCDNGGAQLVILHNDSAGTASSIATSASFPANTRSTDLYRFTLFAPPNGSWVGYTLENLTSGAVTSGKITSDLPAGTVALAPQLWRNNGATALAVRLSVGAFHSETLF